MIAEIENSGNNQTRMAKKEMAAIKPEKISSEPRKVRDINSTIAYPEISNIEESLVAKPKMPPRTRVNPGRVAQTQGRWLCKPLESDFSKTLKKLSGICS